MQSLQPATTPLFPYTTLFRSFCNALSRSIRNVPRWEPHALCGLASDLLERLQPLSLRGGWILGILGISRNPRGRSEEHTSELQSQSNLVCRLLLEKKNPAAPA